jgi:hypothetical protein
MVNIFNIYLFLKTLLHVFDVVMHHHHQAVLIMSKLQAIKRKKLSDDNDALRHRNMKECFKQQISVRHIVNFSIIDHQQIHMRIIKKFNIFLGTLLHVSASWCHPQGALSSWIKLHTIMA